jgi:hypothetical protein
METTLEAWSVYGGFADEKGALHALPWAEMRLQVHRIEDFVAKWRREAEAMVDSPMKLAILRELDGFKKFAPYHAEHMPGASSSPTAQPLSVMLDPQTLLENLGPSILPDLRKVIPCRNHTANVAHSVCPS